MSAAYGTKLSLIGEFIRGTDHNVDLLTRAREFQRYVETV